MEPKINKPLTVLISGAGGAVARTIIPEILSGHVFGPEQTINLRLLELETALPLLQGYCEEILDCAYPLLNDLHITSDARGAGMGAQWAILIGGSPRKDGMTRGDLIKANAPIFSELGKNLAGAVEPSCRFLVVANPCNTNCRILAEAMPDFPNDRFFAMMRLDANRAKSILSKHFGVAPHEITRLAVWGNHSSSQFPDAENCLIKGIPALAFAPHAIEYFRIEFPRVVAMRGDTIIKLRGRSSVESAAHAAADSIRSIITPTPVHDCVALAVASDGSYGIPQRIVCGLPVVSNGEKLSIVRDLPISEFLQQKIHANIEELDREYADAKNAL